MRALHHVNIMPRQLGNMRQLSNIQTEINTSNAVTITQHITAENLKHMRQHYQSILKAIDQAIASEKQRKLDALILAREIKQAKQDSKTRYIAIARIKRKRQLTINQAKKISGMNYTITRDMASKGRKIGTGQKKAAIYNLWINGTKQARICKMLGYSAPYISKTIKAEKEKQQPALFST